MEYFIVNNQEMRQMILADAPDEVQMDHDNPDRESEWVKKDVMIRRRGGILFWQDWLNAYTLKISSAKIQYYFKGKPPSHYLTRLEEAEIGRGMTKPQGENQDPITL